MKLKLNFIVYIFMMVSFIQQANGKQTLLNKMIEKTWVLESKFSSPWKATLLPTFLDFEIKQDFVQTRNLGDKSKSLISYSIENDEIKIGKNLILKIIELTENKLLVEVDNIKFAYYPISYSSTVFDSNKFLGNFKDKKWSYGESELLFTDKQEIAMNSVIGRQMIEYIDNKKYFGTYYVDSFKNNLFCVFIIDGKFPILYFVKEFDETKIVLTTPSSMQILMLAD